MTFSCSSKNDSGYNKNCISLIASYDVCVILEITLCKALLDVTQKLCRIKIKYLGLKSVKNNAYSCNYPLVKRQQSDL